MGGRNTWLRRWFEMTVLSTEPGQLHENEGLGRRATDTFAVAASHRERHLLKE
jgi:hypothetical protein